MEAKMLRAHGGCLGTGSRRRTRQAAISPGEAHSAFDPGISEWGNPAGAMPRYPPLNRIGGGEATGGTETSKYPEEEKSTEIARVAASESAPAQTGERANPWGGCLAGVVGPGCRGPRTLGRGHKPARERNGMGRPAAEGESPVREPPQASRSGSRVGPGT